MSVSTQGYTGPYAGMARYYGFSYDGQGWPQNMGGSNGPNAFLAGVAGQFLNGAAASTLPRRAVTAYSTLTSTGSFNARVAAPGVVLAGARIGPQPAFFPNRNGKTTNTITFPY